MLWAKAHRKQLAERHHLDDLAFAHDRLNLGFARCRRKVGADHVDRRGQRAEFADELTADATGGNGWLWDVTEEPVSLGGKPCSSEPPSTLP